MELNPKPTNLFHKSRKSMQWFFFGTSVLIMLASCAKNSNVLVYHLNVEHQETPVGVVDKNPRMSWKLLVNHRGTAQTAYEVAVASSESNIRSGKFDMWNSGKVLSNCNAFIKYEGNGFESSKTYYWKVRIWDEFGKRSGWSEPSYFETGFVDSSDWSGAKWIGLGEDNREGKYLDRKVKPKGHSRATNQGTFPSPLLRKEFHLKSRVTSAKVYVSGLGYYELYLNGNRVADHVLDPVRMDYDYQVPYVIYDVTKNINSGENAVGVMLGNGFWGQNLAFGNSDLAYGEPRLLMKMNVVYADGSMESIVSDESWKATTGPIIWDNVYGGETYDARKEIKGWNAVGLRDKDWQTAKIMEAPKGQMVPQQLPPIKAVEVISAKKVAQLDDVWLVDFGQNFSGWVRMTLNEEAGTVIRIRTGESTFIDKPELNVESVGRNSTGMEPEFIYICKGTPNEIWEPRFSYHGFRFAEVSGFPGKDLPEAQIKGIAVHNDVQKRSKFECSDSLLNQIYTTSLWTVENNLHGLPEINPNSAKSGGLANAHGAAEFSLLNYDLVPLYEKYLRDIKHALSYGKMHVNIGTGQVEDFKDGNEDANQKAKTSKYLVPQAYAPDKLVNIEAELDWGVAVVLIPYYIYLQTGDIQPFKENYTGIKNLMQYMLTLKDENGIVQSGLGDYGAPNWDMEAAPEFMECSPLASSNPLFYKALRVVEELAPLVDDKSFGTKMGKEADALKTQYNKQFLTPIQGNWWYGSQTATLMALRFDMVPAAKKAEVLHGLTRDITQNHKGHHSTGAFGHRYLYSELSKVGKEDLAYSLLTNPSFPSRRYLLNVGMTTWPERNLPYGEMERSHSLDHFMQSGFAAFFNEGVAGIAPDPAQPGFKNIIMKPMLTQQVEWVEAQTNCPNGAILSSWKSNPKSFEWNISIPANSTATVYLPFTENAKATEGGEKLASVEGVSIVESRNGWLKLNVLSGDYYFVVQR